MEDILVQIATVLDNDYRDKYVDEAVLKWIFDQIVDFLNIREYVSNGFEFGGEPPMLFASGGYDSDKVYDTIFKIQYPRHELIFTEVTDMYKVLKKQGLE